MSHSFKVGDDVICVNESITQNLVRGKIYTVARVFSDSDPRKHLIEVKGNDCRVFASRFKEIKKPAITDKELADEFRKHRTMSAEAHDELLKRGYRFKYNYDNCNAIVFIKTETIETEI